MRPTPSLFQRSAFVLTAAFLSTMFALAQAPPATPSTTTAQLLPYEHALESHTTVKVLPNGLTLVLSERHEAPVFSFFTMVDAGSVDDPEGESGLAHMFEHIAFKGTVEIGTTDYASEKVALANVEHAYADYDDELRNPQGPNPARLAMLRKIFNNAVADAQKYVIPNQFSEIAEANGAVDLDAQTGEDSTDYFWSMPSNRLQLWAYLESSRIGWPVAREFYKERDVVNEERRMRIDSSPQGHLVEEFLAAAYMANPYGVPTVGWPSDIEQVSATEAAAFHKKYYVPSNIVVAVVGDFDTQKVLPMLEKYFDAIPAGPKPNPLIPVEPPQDAERTVVIHEPTQPIYIEGYHKPDYRSPDDAVYDALTDIFSNGRTSRLYRALVRDQKIALDAEGFSDFPGSKYPNLFAFYAVPMSGHTDQQIAAAIHQQLNLLKTTDVTDAELERFKASARAQLLQSFGDNASLAQALATYQTRYGSWQAMFQELNRIDAVTKADIRRVANQTFVATNRTSAFLEYQPPNTPVIEPPPSPPGAANPVPPSAAPATTPVPTRSAVPTSKQKAKKPSSPTPSTVQPKPSANQGGAQ